VASYYAPAGHYSVNSGGLSSAVDNPPLHAIGNATSANGVYAYGSASAFPASTYGAANYWVDVTYSLPKPGQATGVTATVNGGTSAKVTWTAPSDGGPVTSYRITPYVGTTAQTATVVTGSPPVTTKSVTGLTSGTTYTFKVEAVNASGSGPASAQSNAVTPTTSVAPDAPSDVRAQPATKSARVTWTQEDDGGSPLTGQTVTPYIGSAGQTPVQVSASATSTTVTGLDNGTAYTFRVTATNSIGTSPLSAASSAVTPQATVLEFGTPPTVDSADAGGVELGVKFRASFAGAVTGIRFYKAATNTGTHVGNLWTTSGTRLATATFTNESSSGWQSVTFSSPVTVTAGTIYVASYYAPNGHYSVTSTGFSSAILNPPLEAVADSVSSNGAYAYGASSSFPNGTFGSSNYWVDVLYAPAGAPGTPANVTATAGQASASINWSAPSNGGPVASYEVTPYIGSTPQTAKKKTVSGSPPATSTTISGLTSGTAYTFTVRASNQSGAGPESSQSSPVTPTGSAAPSTPTGLSAQGDSGAAILSWNEPADGGSPITSYTVTPFIGSTAQTPTVVDGPASGARISGLTNGTAYTFTVAATNAAGTGSASSASGAVTPRTSIFESGTPATVDAGDPGSVVLGVKFTSSAAGSVTGVRFYKAATNTGSHVAALWGADGTRLAQATFTNERPSGWQAVTFDTPVSIQAGTTYIVSYLAPNGHYSVNANAFTSAISNPPLQALANAVDQNGVYRYDTTSTFPTSSYNAGNYWVDVLFAAGT
jgi:hypothetical protein